MKPVVFRAIVSGSVALLTGLLLLPRSHYFGYRVDTPALTQAAVAEHAASLHYTVLYARSNACNASADSTLFDLPLALSKHPLRTPNASPDALRAELSRRFPHTAWQIEQASGLSLDRVSTFQTSGSLADNRESTEYRALPPSEGAAHERYQVSKIEYTLGGQAVSGGWRFAAHLNRHVLLVNANSPMEDLSAGGGGGTTRAIVKPGWHFVCATGPGSLDTAVWSGQHLIFVYVE